MRNTVKCELCHADTTSTATSRCDRCWELERRIWNAEAIARLVLRRMDEGRRFAAAMRKITDDEAADQAMRDALGDHGQG